MKVPAASPPMAERAGPARVAGPLRDIKFDVDARRTQVESQGLRGPILELTPIRIASLVLGVVVAFLWLRLVAGQAILAAPPADPAYQESSARWALVLTSRRIDAFQRANHRTPTRLSELGYPSWELIGYERLSDSRYRLTAPTPSGPLVLDSIRPHREFLGRSLETLRAAAKVGS